MAMKILNVELIEQSKIKFDPLANFFIIAD